MYRLDGELERIVRVDAPSPKFARERVYREAPSDPHTDQRTLEATRVYNEAISTAEVPDTLPHFTDMLVDAMGYVWLREYQPPQPGYAPWWYVFDPEGRLRYAVRSRRGMSNAVAPFIRLKPDIGTDRIAAVARDADGLEQVLVYRLTRREE